MKKVLLLLLFVAASMSAQQVDLSYYLPNDVTYNKNIPTPKSVIGHEVGEWHITHDKLAEYMKALAKASDRISIESRGTTFEGRPLLLLTITSPKNHQNLETIRKNHIAATDDALVDVDGNFVLNESEQLKLFALRAKLKNLSYTSTEEIDVKTKDHTFQVGMSEKNIIKKNESIDKSVEKAIEHLSVDILYGGSIETPAVILEETLTNYTPYSDIYQDMKESETEVLTRSIRVFTKHHHSAAPTGELHDTSWLKVN